MPAVAPCPLCNYLIPEEDSEIRTKLHLDHLHTEREEFMEILKFIARDLDGGANFLVAGIDGHTYTLEEFINLKKLR